MTRFGHFAQSQDGNISIMLAVLFLALMAAMGAAYDFSRATVARTALQTAVDGAALAAAADSTTDQKKMQSLAAEYLTANEPPASVVNLGELSLSFDPATKTVSAALTGEAPTAFVSLLGVSSVPINAVTSVKRAEPGPLELVLALDTTASMNEKVDDVAKIVTLKTAATNLVKTVMESPYAKVGVVPFSAAVNIGIEYKDASWLTPKPDQTYDYCVVSGGSGLKCEEPRYVSCIVDGFPSTCWQQGKCTWEVEPGTPVCTKKTISWNGCLATRLGYETSIANPGHPKYPYSGTGGPSKMLNLTADQTAVLDKITTLNTAGDTYIPNGLLWAWNLLSPEGPLKTAATAAEMAEKGGKKVAVLMTDGMNTLQPVENGYYQMLDQQKVVDDSLKTLCANVKKDGIILYTVAFNVTDTNIKSILKDCASDKVKFFDAANSSGLSVAFVKIGESLQRLRITM